MGKAPKRKRSVIHVVYRRHNRDERDELFPWRVLAVRLYDFENEECSADQPHVEGLPKALSIHRTKALAIAEGVKVAKAWELSSLRIHKRDGKIDEERSYGTDPRKYRG